MPIIKQQRFDCLPAGNYPARIAAVSLEKGKYGDQLRVKFDLVGDLSGRSVTGWATATFGGRSKLTDWVRAAIFDGSAIPETYDLNTADLLDRRVTLTLIERQGNDGERFNKVDAVNPPRNIGPQPGPRAGGAVLTQTRPTAADGGGRPGDALPDWAAVVNPETFENAGAAIAWGAAQPGAFDSVGSARLVYDALKADHRPTCAAEMWRLWVATVKARQAPAPDDDGEDEPPF